MVDVLCCNSVPLPAEPLNVAFSGVVAVGLSAPSGRCRVLIAIMLVAVIVRDPGKHYVPLVLPAR